MGEATAKMNIADLKKVLNLPESPDSGTGESSKTTPTTPQNEFAPCHQRIHRVRRESMEQLDLIKVVVGFVFCLCSKQKENCHDSNFSSLSSFFLYKVVVSKNF